MMRNPDPDLFTDEELETLATQPKNSELFKIKAYNSWKYGLPARYEI